MTQATPQLPDYSGACLTNVVPTLFNRQERGVPSWMPAVAGQADQVVLLVLDGLGWRQLQERAALAPALSGMAGGPISSVCPTTTSAALSSISLGQSPSQHGVVGYRVHIGERRVLNLLRWRIAREDGYADADPRLFHTDKAFEGREVPVVTRSEFAGGGFSEVHLHGADIEGWRVPSTLVQHVKHHLESGAPFVYAYYDGIDRVAHEFGFGPYYDAELAATDQLVRSIVDVLPTGAVLVVTADHGQVEVRSRPLVPSAEILNDVIFMSGEGRFRWLHTGEPEGVTKRAEEEFSDDAWVVTKEQVLEEEWFGPDMKPEAEARLGDVALVARRPVAFGDPNDSGESNLVCRHGSLTAEEVEVPLLATGD